MGRELGEDTLVASFKEDLSKMKFIEASLHNELVSKLDILAGGSTKRHEKTSVAKDIWKIFFRASLNDITANTRGCEQVCSYFDEFSEYENLLFAIDENHRDHVLHSVWVMLLGVVHPMKSSHY